MRQFSHLITSGRAIIGYAVVAIGQLAIRCNSNAASWNDGTIRQYQLYVVCQYSRTGQLSRLRQTFGNGDQLISRLQNSSIFPRLSDIPIFGWCISSWTIHIKWIQLIKAKFDDGWLFTSSQSIRCDFFTLNQKQYIFEFIFFKITYVFSFKKTSEQPFLNVSRCAKKNAGPHCIPKYSLHKLIK